MLEAASHALVVHHDNPTREYGYDAPQLLSAATHNGWNVLSMRREFTGLWSPLCSSDTR